MLFVGRLVFFLIGTFLALCLYHVIVVLAFEIRKWRGRRSDKRIRWRNVLTMGQFNTSPDDPNYEQYKRDFEESLGMTLEEAEKDPEVTMLPPDRKA